LGNFGLSSRPPKGTSLHGTVHIDVYIVKIGQPWRPAGEVKERKKREKRKSQTVIFHACAQTIHVDRLLPYSEVKVRSPTQTPSFVAIGSGVLLPGVVKFPTFSILRAMAYTTGLGYRPTCDTAAFVSVKNFEDGQ